MVCVETFEIVLNENLKQTWYGNDFCPDSVAFNVSSDALSFKFLSALVWQCSPFVWDPAETLGAFQSLFYISLALSAA